MRVLQITAFSGWGCTGRIAQGICEILIEQGHEATIAWGRNNTAPENIPTIKIGNKYDQITHGIYTRITDRCGFGSKAVTRDFLRRIDEYSPDIIHLHIIHGYYINLELLFDYLKEKKIPVVWTFHDCWAFTGHCPYFDLAGCDKWKSGCRECGQKNHHPKSIFLDNSESNYNKKKELFTGIENLTVVTPSKWLAELVKQSFFKKYPIKVINNGINTEDFKPIHGSIKTRLGIEDKKILLGVSSTWADGKGMKDFIKLSGMLLEEYKVVLVGLSKKQMKDLPGQILGIERTDSVKELAELYTAADIFLNLTYEDNYPTTNLEAIACGTPVITYRTGGSVEIVENTGYGKIVEQGNLSGVIKVLSEVESIKIDMSVKKGLEQKERFLEYIVLYEEVMRKKDVSLE